MAASGVKELPISASRALHHREDGEKAKGITMSSRFLVAVEPEELAAPAQHL
jgi:hypothetical protein